MGPLRSKHLALLAATTLSMSMLSGFVWFDGGDPAAPGFSSEESEDRINVDDIDAMAGHDVAVVDADVLDRTRVL